MATENPPKLEKMIVMNMTTPMLMRGRSTLYGALLLTIELSMVHIEMVSRAVTNRR